MILVTGATGFVGRNLILSLSKKSDRIIGQFRRKKKLDETKSFFIANNKEENFNKIIWRKADITNFSEVQDLFDKVVEVYHCAAYVSMALYKTNYLNLVNITGTTYIVDNCINNKIKYYKINPIKNIKVKYISKGIAIITTSIGISTMSSPFNENITTIVNSKAMSVSGEIFGMK